MSQIQTISVVICYCNIIVFRPVDLRLAYIFIIISFIVAMFLKFANKNSCIYAVE